MAEFVALILDLGMGLLGITVGGVFIFCFLISPIYQWLRSPKLSKNERIQQLQNEVSKLQDQISKLEADNEALSQKEQDLIVQNELLKKKLKTEEVNYLSLNDKYNLALQELSAIKNELKNVKAHNNVTSANCLDINATVSENTKSKQEYATYHEIKEELTQTKNTVNNLRKDLQHAKERIASIAAENIKIKQENSDLIFIKNDDLEKANNLITSLLEKQEEDRKHIDNLQKNKNSILKKYNELFASHSKITKSFEKNEHLFYGITPEFKMLYKKMDAKRLFRSFDPTLSFISTKFEIGHSDKPNDKIYRTTLISCTCDDFSMNLKSSAPCKHMIFLAYNLGNMFYYKEEAKRYLKTDVAFLAEKENVEKELKNKRKKLKEIKKELKELESDLSHPIKNIESFTDEK